MKSLPPVSEMLHAAGISANKALGQHFLFDLNLTARIAKSIPDIKNTIVYEIGGGPGGLTRALLDAGARRVVVVERDARMIELQNQIRDFYGADKLEIINADALKLNADFYRTYDAPRAVCSNLPYNVGTELLVNWLHHIGDFTSLTLMFQREVANRIIAAPRDENYGRLSILAAATSHAKKLFDVSPTCFTPPPRVWSSVIQLTPETAPTQLANLEKLTAVLFSSRRKMIRASLKNKNVDFNTIGLSETARPEELSLQELLTLTTAVFPK